ncbi:MAG: hypothetical protein WA956_12030 [Stenotrophomonas sp.]
MNRQARVFTVLAMVLLVGATLALHIGLPLWDHIDLVPIYHALQEGDVSASGFWRVHDGSHLHVSAYAVLLLTTWLSHGRPWLDCLVSALLMAGVAVLLLRLARRVLPQGLARGWWFVIGLLAFYPGHLVNLQWGWQVAVFISLLGMVAPVFLLTAPGLRWGGLGAGLLAAVLGVMSFSTTLVVFPVAVVLLLLRPDWSLPRRIAGVLPWLLALAGLVAWLRWDHAGAAVARPQWEAMLLYAGNYLASGVLHFSQPLALPWLGLALVLAIPAACKAPRQRMLPCLALMVCAAGAALLTALGRAAPFGPEHGFVTRYVSYSILFWFGWFVLVLGAFAEQPGWRRWLRPLLLLAAVVGTFNALHMAKKAVVVSRNADAYARQIVSQYPNYDPQLLERAYGPGRDRTAPELLGIWRQYGFAPFERETE